METVIIIGWGKVVQKREIVGEVDLVDFTRPFFMLMYLEISHGLACLPSL